MLFKNLLFLVLFLPQLVCANATIPDEILPPSENIAFLTLHAKGDQIYQCSLSAGVFMWQLKAPDARLYDDVGHIVGSHYTGPIWDYKEGARVVGKVVEKVNLAPETAISWLLVQIVSHKGAGLLADVSFINRINTTGGLSPLTGCNSNHLGLEKRSAYTADYIFYAKP